MFNNMHCVSFFRSLKGRGYRITAVFSTLDEGLLKSCHVLFGSGYGFLWFLFSWLFARGKLTCLNLELRVPLPLRKDMVLPLKLNETVITAACENSCLPLAKFRQEGNVPTGEELRETAVFSTLPFR